MKKFKEFENDASGVRKENVETISEVMGRPLLKKDYDFFIKTYATDDNVNRWNVEKFEKAARTSNLALKKLIQGFGYGVSSDDVDAIRRHYGIKDSEVKNYKKDQEGREWVIMLPKIMYKLNIAKFKAEALMVCMKKQGIDLKHVFK